MWISVLFSVIGFLLGGVLFSYHVPRLLCGVDVTQCSADGNPGTYNAMKLCGPRVGLTCLALDMAKGFLPAWGALRCLQLGDPWLAPVLIAPVLGHALAVFYPFGGGKAVAVSFGVLLGLAPHSAAVAALAVPYLALVLFAPRMTNERKTVWSFAAFAALCLVCRPLTGNTGVTLGAAGMALIVVWKNRARSTASCRAPAEARN